MAEALDALAPEFPADVSATRDIAPDGPAEHDRPDQCVGNDFARQDELRNVSNNNNVDVDGEGGIDASSGYIRVFSNASHPTREYSVSRHDPVGPNVSFDRRNNASEKLAGRDFGTSNRGAAGWPTRARNEAARHRPGSGGRSCPARPDWTMCSSDPGIRTGNAANSRQGKVGRARRIGSGGPTVPYEWLSGRSLRF